MKKEYVVRQVLAKYSDYETLELGPQGIYTFSVNNPFIPLNVHLKGIPDVSITSGRVILINFIDVEAIQDYFPIYEPLIPQTGFSAVFSGTHQKMQFPNCDINSLFIPAGEYHIISDMRIIDANCEPFVVIAEKV